ncbi:MAG: carboxypeptidase-like regulatory domain-containing protein [Bacteroidales bacterium]|nr:carboxypeptidase-like regulatory domain-containing protein [Bacteroidales bacterium]
MILFSLKIFRKTILSFVLMVLVSVTYGQITKIMGKVIDAENQQPLPFVNVYLIGTNIGTITNFEGEYSFETRNPSDSIAASFVGYNTVTKKVEKNKFQVIDFYLYQSSISLSEVVVVAGENPADILLRKIIKNKVVNNRKNFDYYQYEVYNKIQFDANNITEKFRNRKILKPFKFVFSYVDTSTINGKAYLPLFLSESLSDVYYRGNPKSKKEMIKASQTSGFENESISQFLGDLYQNINIYDNYISIFEKNFVSPIANFGLSYYKYYLVDTAIISDKLCYQIMFKPKRKQELTFTGNFWVNDTSYAIKELDMRIVDDANINFINDLALRQEYDRIEKKYWMITKDYMVVDFNVIENTKRVIGFFGHRTTTYKNFVFNQQKEKNFYSTPVNVSFEEGSFDKDEEFWENARHDSLTKKEQTIYEMVDSVKSIPVFKTYVDIIYMITNGYYIKGPVEIGPYYKMISFNEIEGVRFRLGGRTSNDFSTKLMLSAHVAYGTKDEKFKYGLGFLYMLSKNPRRSFGASYLYDIEQLGQSENAYSEDNLFASFFRRNPANKLSMVRQYKAFYQHEWFTGFSNTINFIHRDIFPVGSTTIEIYNNGVVEEKTSIITSEIRLDTRIAYDEKFVMGEFVRISLGTTYPVFGIRYGYGIPGFLNGEYEYHRLQVGLKDWFNVFSYGWSKIIIEAGKTWGTLPYPLLILHPGNETFIFDEYAYNLMNYFEFISDQYISVYYTHHFDGLFLNKIPLMRKLKWREVAYIKGVIGTLSEKNEKYSKFPSITYSLDKPYYEAGVGIENIFRVLRIDAIWRLSHLDNPGIDKFAVFFSFQFSF